MCWKKKTQKTKMTTTTVFPTTTEQQTHVVEPAESTTKYSESDKKTPKNEKNSIKSPARKTEKTVTKSAKTDKKTAAMEAVVADDIEKENDEQMFANFAVTSHTETIKNPDAKPSVSKPKSTKVKKEMTKTAKEETMEKQDKKTNGGTTEDVKRITLANDEPKAKGTTAPTQTPPAQETLSTKLMTRSFKDEKKKQEMEELSRVPVFKDMKIQHAKFPYNTPTQMDTLTGGNSNFSSSIGPEKEGKSKDQRIKQKTRRSKTRRTKEKRSIEKRKSTVEKTQASTVS